MWQVRLLVSIERTQTSRSLLGFTYLCPIDIRPFKTYEMAFGLIIVIVTIVSNSLRSDKYLYLLSRGNEKEECRIAKLLTQRTKELRRLKVSLGIHIYVFFSQDNKTRRLA